MEPIKLPKRYKFIYDRYVEWPGMLEGKRFETFVTHYGRTHDWVRTQQKQRDDFTL